MLNNSRTAEEAVFLNEIIKKKKKNKNKMNFVMVYICISRRKKIYEIGWWKNETSRRR